MLVASSDRWCSEHAKRGSWGSDRLRGTRQQRGYGRAWERIRAVVMQRDRGLCQPCLSVGRITAATEVDHIKGKAVGGGDDEANLQAICGACHRTKTAAESGIRGNPIYHADT